MDNSKLNRVPPIITDYINKLNDERSSLFQRDNACLTLELIVEVANQAIFQFKKKRNERKR